MKIKASLLVASMLLSVSSFAAETYKVSTTLQNNGELIASPVMVVEANKEASISIGSEFKYSLTVVPNSDETATVSTAIQSGETSMTPVMTVAYDKEAMIQLEGHQLSIVVSKAGS